ncbi:hypothetical protein AAEO56_09305 [Flavobacterium sp. DGU11]|uniref:Uncharacterized protein n=1 Tax=Flavobacterium arundinis TaxID=3139143 RepID=A0ABU9HWA9_9FLAO
MKKLIAGLLLFGCYTAVAQVKLSDSDFKNLVAISEIRSKDYMANGKDYDKSLKKLRTPKLSHILDVLMLLDGNDKALLNPEHLTRPDNEELQLWYVLNEIGNNLQEDNKNPRPNIDVAKETLAKQIDERWLVDNYYNELDRGLSMLFNEKDLSAINLDIDSYRLKNQTEKVIFFLNITKPFIQRFQVLNHVKNPDKLMEFAARMPQFNGKGYYAFTNFDFEDFEYPYDDGMASYTMTGLQQYYHSLMCHFMATAEKGMSAVTREIYYNSILSVPKYFKYSGVETDLTEIYNDAKK